MSWQLYRIKYWAGSKIHKTFLLFPLSASAVGGQKTIINSGRLGEKSCGPNKCKRKVIDKSSLWICSWVYMHKWLFWIANDCHFFLAPGHLWVLYKSSRPCQWLPCQGKRNVASLFFIGEEFSALELVDVQSRFGFAYKRKNEIKIL